ncbi:MAG: hypothetical protein RBS88_01665 [Spongiibacteraceae bacterium]|jgi:hypothetical protein|nr:hypothetical protein [Spongiibacteraceae bacterium]
MSDRWLIRNRKYALGLAIVALLLGSTGIPMWQMFAPSPAMAQDDTLPTLPPARAPFIASVPEALEPELLPPLPPLPRAIAQAKVTDTPIMEPLTDALGGGEPRGTGGGGGGDDGGTSVPGSTFGPGEFDFLPSYRSGGIGGGVGSGNTGTGGGSENGDDSEDQPGQEGSDEGESEQVGPGQGQAPGDEAGTHPGQERPGQEPEDEAGNPGNGQTPEIPGLPGFPIDPPPYEDDNPLPLPTDPINGPGQQPVAVMEPSAAWLFMLGCVGLVMARRQSRQS